MPQPTYPIAKAANDALKQVREGATVRAGREREAGLLSGKRVAFVSETIGPVYERREDAVSAIGSAADDPAMKLLPRLKSTSRKTKAPMQPVFKDGQRWPKATIGESPVWQVSISYWKTLDGARERPAPSAKPARALRRKGGHALTPEEVLSLTESPMLAIRPQKALDFGLFDFALPENPGIIIADE